MRKELRTLVHPELSVPQFRVLAHVAVGHRTISELAELHTISLPAMSKIVDGMVKRGFLTRVNHQKDRRVFMLALTPAGKKAQRRIERGIEKKFAALFEDVSTADCRDVVHGLKVLEEIFA